MSLQNFVIHKEPVAFQGVVVASVRGLALKDVTVLVRGHLAELNRLMALYDDENQRNNAMTEAARYAIKILEDSPDLAAKMIALACDEPDQVEKAGELPMPLQIEFVRKIIQVTFEEFGGVKKFIDSVMTLVIGLTPAVNNATD